MGVTLDDLMNMSDDDDDEELIPKKRGRGRPPGSKRKVVGHSEKSYYDYYQKLSSDVAGPKPSHFESKLETEWHGDVKSNTVFYTEEGIRQVTIFKKEDSYKYKVYDTDYDILEEGEYDSLEEVEEKVKLYIDGQGELENEGLIKCMKGVMKKIGQLNNENWFLFKLLVGEPEERKQYAKAKPKKKKTYNPLDSDHKDKEKYRTIGNNLRGKIKGVTGM